MSPVLKILHITPTLYPAVGGIETVVRELMLNLRSRGFVADAMHVAPGNPRRKDSLDNSIVWKVPLFPNRLIGVIPPVRRIFQQYDVLHVHDPQIMALSLNILLQSHGKRVLLSTHGGYRHTNQYNFAKDIHWKWVAPALLGRYDEVLASSSSDLEVFRTKAPRTKLVPNGVNIEKFLLADVPARANPMRWLYWGRLSRNKRLDSMIDLIAQLRDSGLSIDVLISGADFDALRTSLLARIERLRLGAQVRLAGQLSDQELLREVVSRSIFISASEHEGFGLSVIEAMAAGMIVICRDIAPLNRFVAQDTTGALLRFDGGTADLELVQKLCMSSNDVLLAMRESARTVAQQHSWNSIIDRYIDAYQTCGN